MLFDFEHVGSREVRLRPEGEAADLLVRRQLLVDGTDDGGGVHALFDDERGVDFDVAALPHEADDHAVSQAGLLTPMVLDVVGEDVLAVGENDQVLLRLLK